MGRGIAIVLAVSLGLNFFMAGYLLHDVVRPPPPPPFAEDFRGFNNPRGLIGAARALPPETRRAFRTSFQERLPDMRNQHREMRLRREELRVLIEADEWDADAVAAKMDEIRVLHARQREAFDKAFIDAVGALSGEDRRRMIEDATQMRMERHKKRRGRMKPPPPER